MKAAKCIVRVGVFAGCLLVEGCGRRQPPAKPPPRPEQKPTASGIAKGLVIVGNDSKGRPLYEVRTRNSTQSEVNAEATLTNTRVTLYHEGVPDLVVAAPQARVDIATRDLLMWGGLTARAVRQGAAFRVDRMTWNARSHLFSGAGNVRYSRPPVTMSADRVNGKTPLTVINLSGNVRMNIGASEAAEGNGR